MVGVLSLTGTAAQAAAEAAAARAGRRTTTIRERVLYIVGRVLAWFCQFGGFACLCFLPSLVLLLLLLSLFAWARCACAVGVYKTKTFVVVWRRYIEQLSMRGVWGQGRKQTKKKEHTSKREADGVGTSRIHVCVCVRAQEPSTKKGRRKGRYDAPIAAAVVFALLSWCFCYRDAFCCL